MSEPTKASIAAKIVSLNEQFLQWIQSQDKKSLWLDGIEDYRDYAAAISKELSEASNEAPEPTETKSSGLFNFSGHVGQAAFGAPVAPVGGSGGPSPAPIGKPEQEVVNLDDEDDAPPREEEKQPEISEESKAEVLFTKKIHLLTQDPESKKWKDKGTGTFSLRKSKPADDGKQVSYIVFTAATGKVLINAPVIKGMKPMVNAKANSNVIMFLISRDETGEEKKQMHLFKCGSSEAAADLASAVSAEA
jgi:hypothetical protein